ncbi:expressed protein [Phakopsora pachyrhizi]|uniref:Expressed protein n=1 Tax=Phakopsora pachyrhizi TaxID=170000 RepID=A0AAV0AFD8_PHAPC|nr:expressed protein [Phakopsora pachyrhizi]
MILNFFTFRLRWPTIYAIYLFRWLHCMEFRDSLTATKLATEPRHLDLTIPQNRVENSLGLNLGKFVTESLQPKKQESSLDASMIAKFDLNEIPTCSESEVSHKQIEKIGSLRGETTSSQTYKRKASESVDDDLLMNISSSSKRLEQDFSTYSSKSGFKNSIIATVLATETSEKKFKPHEYDLLFDLNKSPTNTGVIIHDNDAIMATPPRGQQYKNDKNVIPTSKNKERESLRRDFWDTFIKSLLTRKNTLCPFNIESKTISWSPYNKVLLNILEKNIKHIMPESLSDYEFSDSFLDIIKNNFWKKEQEVFAIKEDLLAQTIYGINAYFKNKNNPSWVNFSTKDLRSKGEKSASKLFSFRVVFHQLITYENVSEFFYTNKIKQKMELFFEQLKTRLSEKVTFNKKKINVL